MRFSCFLYAALLVTGLILPAAAQIPTAATEAFPQLPRSRACTENDLKATLWKLLRVYESPVGTETTTFLTNPSQYILFRPNNTYTKYNSSADLPVGTIHAEINKHISGLQQYLVDPSGFIFFYQDKKPSDTQACFIVVNPVGQFVGGQMLLMPPEGTVQGRLVKVYARITEQPQHERKRGRR